MLNNDYNLCIYLRVVVKMGLTAIYTVESVFLTSKLSG